MDDSQNASVGPMRRALNHTLRALARYRPNAWQALSPMGTTRSLPPLPKLTRTKPFLMSTSASVSLWISWRRMPQE